MNTIQRSQYESEILELIDNADEFTRSDLQGVVSVIVNKIYQTGVSDTEDKQVG